MKIIVMLYYRLDTYYSILRLFVLTIMDKTVYGRK